MKITVETPNVMSVFYQQERGDPEYGSCMWARFYFDLSNYTMCIESDCGDYIYGWIPTTKTESFLHLCARFNEDYLLSKIASRIVVNGDETWKAIKELLEYAVGADNDEDRNEDMRAIEDACYHHDTEKEAHDAIMSAIEGTFFSGEIEGYDVWQAIEMDYPANAKKIVSVFDAHIKPKLKELAEEENG